MSRSLLQFLALILLAAAIVQAATASRIELKDGSVYQNASYSLDDQYKVVTIKAVGVNRTVSYTQISLIADESGADITAACIGEYYNPGQQSRPAANPGDSATAPATPNSGVAEKEVPITRRPPFALALGGGGNFSFPSGDYYDGIGGGIGFDLIMYFPVSREIAIRGSFSRAGLRDDFEHIGGTPVVVDRLSLNAYRFVIAAQYYEWPRARSGGRMMYYLWSGLGGISHTLSGSLTIHDDAIGDVVVVPEKRSDTKFLVESGLGAVAMVSPGIGIDAGILLDMVFIGKKSEDAAPSYPFYDNTERAYIIDLKIGVTVVF